VAVLELDDRYHLTERIGRGGVGEVFRGVQVALDRPVAIKLLRSELTVRADVVHRFEQEARTTCRLHHPNVVTVFDVGTAPNGARFLVMELLEGRTLADALREGRMEMAEALDIAVQVARGMGAGQGVGLVHRDLKPENIFLLADGQVKILDFGLALLHQGLADAGTITEDLDLAEITSDLSVDETWNHSLAAIPDRDVEDTDSDSPRLTRPGSLVGTPRYMSPEQALCWAVDHRADLYAFGCILFEMTTGEAPFEGTNVQDYLQLHVHEPAPPPSEFNKALSPAIDALVLQLLEKDPTARPRDWAEVSERLRRLGGEEPAKPGAATPRAQERKPTEPYRFLQPFTASTRAVFFGRDQDARRFRGIWEHPDQAPLVALIGSSGVGKTSFVAARVIPGLEDTGHAVLRVRGGSHPTRELAAIAARQLARASGSSEPSDVPLPRLLDQLVALWQRPVAVVLDQLEELFTAGDDADRERFQTDIAALIAGSDGSTRLLFSLREDFHGALLRCLHPLPVDEVMRTMPLHSLGPQDIADALEGPTDATSQVDYATFHFEPGLVRRIVTDLLADDGPVAPRIQVVGHRLWEMRDPSGAITGRSYEHNLGGARGILGRVLDDAVDDLPASDQGVAKELLRALTRLPGSATSAPAPEAALLGAHADADQRARVLERLESRWRLVQGYSDSRWPKQRAYRIAHEALIARIKEYGEDDSERNRARQLFAHGMDLWLRNGRQDVDLLVEEHFDVVQRHATSLVWRSGEAEAFYTRCRQVHSEAWWQREQRKRRNRQFGWARRYVPVALALGLGFILGQVPVGFRSFHAAEVKVMAALGMERADLTGQDLAMSRLDGITLLAPDFTGADLRYASMRGADLQQATFESTNLGSADLAGAVLIGTAFVDAELDNANFRGADLRQARMQSNTDGADFTGAWFDLGTSWLTEPPYAAMGPQGDARGANLDGMVLDGLDLFAMQLQDASLRGASLVKTSLVDAVLHRADLREADLSGGDLRDAEFLRADMRWSVLAHTKLFRARMSTADMRGVSVVGADLSGTALDGARLEGALADTETRWPMEFDPVEAGVILLSGDLTGMDLSTRVLDGAKMDGAVLNDAVLASASLVNTSLVDASLEGADLSNARLTGAVLDGASLCGADLRGAELSGTSFRGAKVCDNTRFSAGYRPPGL
jgi:uncharacterized protein YjbI with pentapeptide repeats/serine/threonine protein kinase